MAHSGERLNEEHRTYNGSAQAHFDQSFARRTLPANDSVSNTCLKSKGKVKARHGQARRGVERQGAGREREREAQHGKWNGWGRGVAVDSNPNLDLSMHWRCWCVGWAMRIRSCLAEARFELRASAACFSLFSSLFQTTSSPSASTRLTIPNPLLSLSGWSCSHPCSPTNFRRAATSGLSEIFLQRLAANCSVYWSVGEPLLLSDVWFAEFARAAVSLKSSGAMSF